MLSVSRHAFWLLRWWYTILPQYIAAHVCVTLQNARIPLRKKTSWSKAHLQSHARTETQRPYCFFFLSKVAFQSNTDATLWRLRFLLLYLFSYIHISIRHDSNDSKGKVKPVRDAGTSVSFNIQWQHRRSFLILCVCAYTEPCECALQYQHRKSLKNVIGYSGGVRMNTYCCSHVLYLCRCLCILCVHPSQNNCAKAIVIQTHIRSLLGRMFSIKLNDSDLCFLHWPARTLKQHRNRRHCVYDWVYDWVILQGVLG